jgi:hypothetical protein
MKKVTRAPSPAAARLLRCLCVGIVILCTVPLTAYAGGRLERAEKTGGALATAVQSGDKFNPATLVNYSQLKKALSDRLCANLAYAFYRIGGRVYVRQYFRRSYRNWAPLQV